MRPGRLAAPWVQGRFRRKHILSTLYLFALSVVALLSALPVAAQGCSVCRDATAGAAPQQIRALRRAIPLLGLPAIGVLLGGLVIAKKIKPDGE